MTNRYRTPVRARAHWRFAFGSTGVMITGTEGHEETPTMTVRTFVFCDVCNSQGIRSIELRRSPARHGGRRVTDDRSWFEGTQEEAAAAGWEIDQAGRHICRRCMASASERARSDLATAGH